PRVHHGFMQSSYPIEAAAPVKNEQTEGREAQGREELIRREQLERAEAEAAVRARDDVLAIVTHDLRNPLNTIAMCSSLLGSGLPAEKASEQLAIIGRAIAGMNR